MTEKFKDFKWIIPEGIVTAAAVLALTGLFYGLFAVRLISVLSDYYYALALYSTTKNLFTIASISIDAATYALVGFVTGVLLTKYLLWYDKKMQNSPRVTG